MADKKVFLRTALTGGGAGALDSIDGLDRGDGNPLQDGDVAITLASGYLYVHLGDADSAAAESVPGVIEPDTNPGDFRWINQGISTGYDIADYLEIADFSATLASCTNAATAATASTPPLDADEFPFYKAVGAALRKVTWSVMKSVLKTYFDGFYVYTLPTASAGTLGGIKVGTRLAIDGSGVLSASDQSYTLPTASAATLGGVKVGSGLVIAAGVLSVSAPTNTSPDPTPDSNLSVSGPQATMTAGETLVFGNLCYLKSDGKWWKADADQNTTMPGMAIACATIATNATGVFALPGSFLRDDSWNWTLGAIGGLIYAGTDLGGLAQTAPSGSGDQVQIVGYAYTADIMFFNPSPVIAEVA